jgi:hypothetical protein
MSISFRVVFNFTAEDDGVELSVKSGEVVQLLNDDTSREVEDGWIEVRNSYGRTGFVPRDYIEIIPTELYNTPATNVKEEGEQAFEPYAQATPATATSSVNDTSPNSQSSLIGDNIYYADEASGIGSVVMMGSGNNSFLATPFATASSETTAQQSPQSMLDTRYQSSSYANANASTLYELAAESSAYLATDEPPPITYSAEISPSKVSSSYNSSAVDRSAVKSNTFRADKFVNMTSSKPKQASFAVTEAQVTPMRSHYDSQDIGNSSTRPMLSTAAASGNYDELIKRIDDYFRHIGEKAQERSTAFIDTADEISQRLADSLSATNTLLDDLRKVSQSLDQEKSDMVIFSKTMNRKNSESSILASQ